jgi:hypothetical protein
MGMPVRVRPGAPRDNMQYIDNDVEHNLVLYQLGILDDDEDYLLFLAMKREEVDIDNNTWATYMGPLREVPKGMTR